MVEKAGGSRKLTSDAHCLCSADFDPQILVLRLQTRRLN